MAFSQYFLCREPIVLLAVLLASSRVLAGSDARVLTAPEALDRVESRELSLIDVRSPAEWRKTGIPELANPVTIHQSGGPSAFYRAITEAVGDKDRPIALICTTGM
jgi:rhodanese-related sulfurtransferase